MHPINKTVLGALTLAAVLAGPLGPAPARAQEKIRVVATLPVLAELVKAVGGDRV